MPHKPSNHDRSVGLGAHRCFNCLWNEAAQPCPVCLCPQHDSLADAVQAGRDRDTWYAYTPSQQAALIEREQRDEADKLSAKPDAVMAGSASTDRPITESLDSFDSAVRQYREYLRVQRDKELRPHKPAPPSQLPSEPIIAMLEPTAICRITGTVYRQLHFQPDGSLIGTFQGEEHLLPAGSYDIEFE